MSSIPAEPAPLPAGISANAMSSLFGAINGLRNTRALTAMMACTVGGVVVALLMTVLLGAGIGSLLGALIWIVAAGTGLNAAGALHMDHARGISPRSTVDALVHGLLCLPKLIALAILLFLVELAVFLVIAIVLFICKIPFLGPVLFAVAFPVSVVVAGITVLGLFLCLVLSLPAIWQGATIMRALSQTLAIARSRIVESILLLAVVWLLSFVVALIVFGVLLAGLMPTIGMSAGIVGFGGGFGSMMGGGLGGIGHMGGMGGGGGGHAIAGMLGGGVLYAVAATLVAQVYLLGLCLVYLRVTEGLDLSATEAALRQKLDEARSRASDLGDKARAAANRAAAPSPAPVAPPAGAQPAYPPAPPAYTPPAPPPAFMASTQAPSPSGAMAAGGAAAAGYAAAPPAYTPPAYTPPAYTPPAAYPPEAPPAAGTDIDLPFDDLPPAAATPPAAIPSQAPPAYAPPAYVPPPATPAAAPLASTCPQCLSPVTAEDVFCGVCGYRLK